VLWHMRLIYPDAAFYRHWSLLMAFPMLYTALLTPLFIGLLEEPPVAIFVFDRIMDVVFITDLVRLLVSLVADSVREHCCADVKRSSSLAHANMSCLQVINFMLVIRNPSTGGAMLG
jgi:hypothetical protein